MITPEALSFTLIVDFLINGFIVLLLAPANFVRYIAEQDEFLI